MATWKLKNTSNQSIKVAIARNTDNTTGVIIPPGEFVLCEGRMTSSLDAQVRRNYISIEKDFKNIYKLTLCKTYSEKQIEQAIKQVQNYTES